MLYLWTLFVAIVQYLHSLISGLHYLHSKHVIHRDLKVNGNKNALPVFSPLLFRSSLLHTQLDNLLIDSRGVLKIADFGNCSHSVKLRSKRFCGMLAVFLKAFVIIIIIICVLLRMLLHIFHVCFGVGASIPVQRACS